MSPEEERLRLVDLVVQKSRWSSSIKRTQDEINVSLLLGFVDDSGDVQLVDDLGLPTVRRDLKYEDVAGTAGTGQAVYTPSCTQEIVGVLADIICNATVDDRAMTVAVNRTLRASGTPTVVVIWRSEIVSVQASEYGAIWIPNNRSGYYYVSDNGSLSPSTLLDSPVPFECTVDNTIACQFTNAKAGDLAHLRICYKKVAN